MKQKLKNWIERNYSKLEFATFSLAEATGVGLYLTEPSPLLRDAGIVLSTLAGLTLLSNLPKRKYSVEKNGVIRNVDYFIENQGNPYWMADNSDQRESTNIGDVLDKFAPNVVSFSKSEGLHVRKAGRGDFIRSLDTLEMALDPGVANFSTPKGRYNAWSNCFRKEGSVTDKILEIASGLVGLPFMGWTGKRSMQNLYYDLQSKNPVRSYWGINSLHNLEQNRGMDLVPCVSRELARIPEEYFRSDSG